MKTPITREVIRHHLSYAWWKYALLAVVAIFGWNIIYTVTAYQPPAHKKVDMFVYAPGEQELLANYMEHIRRTEMADMEEMSAVFQVIDEAYTPMQLMTFLAAGEGDLYILPKDYFQSYASQGAFVPLENVPGLVDSLKEAGVSVDRGWRTFIDPNAEEGEATPTDEKHLYGIPMASFPGFAQYSYGYDDCYLSIIMTNGNDENSIKFLQIFLEDMLDPDHQVPVLEPAK